MIRIPIIKVKNGSSEYSHIIGTDRHDTLYLDKESGGLQYCNSQCMAGTKIYRGEQEYKFDMPPIPNDNPEYTTTGNPEIEFVGLDEFINIISSYIDEKSKTDMELLDMLKKLNIKEIEEHEKLSSAQDEAGIKWMI